MAQLENALAVLVVLLLVAHIALWIRDIRIARREGSPRGELELWNYPLDQSRKMRFTVMAVVVLGALTLGTIGRIGDAM